MHRMKFFQPQLGKGWLFSFIVSIHLFWLVLQSPLRGVIRQLYTHYLCLFGSFLLKSPLWYPEWWNLHSPPKMIAYTFKWSYDILDTVKIPWMLDSVHDTCENRTWVSIVCPKIHPTCGPLQIMQASSALRHFISVKPIMLPSQRSA